jgi:hypothetical protein
VVVGHSLPRYFLNAVRSLRSCVPEGDLLVIDNASPESALRAELIGMSEVDGRLEVISRSINDVRLNGKVGSLYAAYEVAFARALEKRYGLLHLIQSDFQVLWWDDEVEARAMEIYDEHPCCVNIHTALLSRDILLGDQVEVAEPGGVLRLRRFGLTDTGLYHLGRWASMGMQFALDETIHAERYRAAGLEVLCHPWPTDAPIPWPAAIRGGRRMGREVRSTAPFLLRPASPETIAKVKGQAEHTWLEDICVPWGWVCATPMLTTSLDSVDYWVSRYRDARHNGLRHLLPRPVAGGASWWQLTRSWPPLQHRPSVVRLVVLAPLLELRRRLLARFVARRGRRS